jgi:carbon starvation protein
MLYIPMIFMFAVTLIALIMSIYGIVHKLLYTGAFNFLTDGLQLIVAIALITLATLIAFHGVGKLTDSSNTAAVQTKSE